MPDLTAAQKTVVQAKSRQACALLKLDLPTPLYYCTHHTTVSHDSQKWTPKRINAAPLPLAELFNSTWSVEIEDTDKTLVTDWKDNRSDWNGIDIQFLIIARVDPGDDWTEIIDRTWTRTTTEYDPNVGWMKIHMRADTSVRQRAGLFVGNHESCPYAPDPKNPLTILSGYLNWPVGTSSNPPPPTGANDPNYYGTRQDNPDTTTTYTDGADELMAEANVGTAAA